MARDPNYDRYAGIKSLEDDRQRRPFRVDEDGNVIYKDDAHDIDATAAPNTRAPAGILNWDEADRMLDERAALPQPQQQDILATAGRGSSLSGTGQRVITTRMTIGGIDYDVISANTFDPALSNGKTAIPNAEMIARMNGDIGQVAVKGTGPEKGSYIIRLPLDFSAKEDDAPAGERNLPLMNPKGEIYYSLPSLNAKPGKTRTADTLDFGRPSEFPVGTVALQHGHPDGDSDGMIDDWDPLQKPHPIIGDVGSLLGDNPLTMATVSKGRLGWHQLENGRLQYVHPSGMDFSPHEAEEIQKKLNLQQSLFQRKAQ